ncbi:hypothetical protein [Kocuria palustris]|uniref:hypothetical protein n=1 Tax=Kocuria palustris TaxID=71999 RepID=UPI00242E2C8F|nr:hypothetical protein [Kocuria palustris]
MLENFTSLAPAATAVGDSVQTTALTLAPAAFDVGNLLQSATSTLKGWGGLLIILMGVVGLIVFAVLAIKKLMASEQQQTQEAKWSRLVLLLIASGAFVGGGWSLVSDLGSGGETTIRDLGSGTAVVHQLDGADSVLTGF